MRIALARSVLSVLPLVAAAPAWGDEPLRVTYRTYAVGLHIADVEASLGIGAWSYQVNLAFRTTGLVGALYHGHQDNAVFGTWDERRPMPRQYSASGLWRGEPRVTVIDYNQGIPLIRQLLPPPEPEREPVPANLQANSTDSLSALAALVRAVAHTGRCETTVRTYDGRRSAEIIAHTVGPEALAETSRTSFSGKALRCDFVSRMLAGFRFDEASKTDFRPLRGSAWLADIIPGRAPVPVRMTIETRWFGDATSYLTAVDNDTAAVVAERLPSGR